MHASIHVLPDVAITGSEKAARNLRLNNSAVKQVFRGSGPRLVRDRRPRRLMPMGYFFGPREGGWRWNPPSTSGQRLACARLVDDHARLRAGACAPPHVLA